MNPLKTGNLIFTLRKKKSLTQKNLASLINVSDKAICKWEKGRGCPDITLLPAISLALDVSIENILRGELEKSHYDGGNMNKLRIYRCKNCNNIITSTKIINIECCGFKLHEVTKTEVDNLEEKDNYLPIVTEVDNSFFVKLEHPMTKQNYISAVIIIYYDRLNIINMYPEQEASFTLTQLAGSKIFVVTNTNQLIKIM